MPPTRLDLETAKIPLVLSPVEVETGADRAQRTLAGLAHDCPANAELVSEGFLPPEALVAGSVHLLSSHFDIQGGIYAREQVTFYRPVSLGETLFVDGSLAARFVKRGRLYRQVVSRTEDSGGALVAESRTTSLAQYTGDSAPEDVALGHAAAPGPSSLLESPNAERLRPLAVDTEFVGPPRAYTLQMMRDETGPDDRNPIHTDPETARRAGLERPIAGGPHVLSAVYELVLAELGLTALSYGAHTDVRWVSPVADGDVATPHLRVHENQDSTVTLAATVSVDERLALAATIEIPF